MSFLWKPEISLLLLMEYDSNLAKTHSVILREQFDYTKWHRDMFDDMTLHELNTAAAEYAKKHPYTGKGMVI